MHNLSCYQLCNQAQKRSDFLLNEFAKLSRLYFCNMKKHYINGLHHNLTTLYKLDALYYFHYLRTMHQVVFMAQVGQ